MVLFPFSKIVTDLYQAEVQIPEGPARLTHLLLPLLSGSSGFATKMCSSHLWPHGTLIMPPVLKLFLSHAQTFVHAVPLTRRAFPVL